MTTFQTFGSHYFLFLYGTATKFARFVDNLFGFTKLLTESKYYISVLRYVTGFMETDPNRTLEATR